MAKDTVGSVRDGYSQIMSAITTTMTAPDAQLADLAFLGKLQENVLLKLHSQSPVGGGGPQGQGMMAPGGQPPPGAGGPPGMGGPPPPQGNPMTMQSAPGQGVMPMSAQPNADELRALLASRSGG